MLLGGVRLEQDPRTQLAKRSEGSAGPQAGIRLWCRERRQVVEQSPLQLTGALSQCLRRRVLVSQQRQRLRGKALAVKDRLLHGSESLSQLSPDGTGGLQLGLGQLHMALGKGTQQRLLVREVLVQRADANAGRFGDAVGGGGEALALENPSRGL